ncbi:hypothetical protein MKW98_027745 [Papaver atlanticum]|uniref:beta-ketoacyl-[acyl-carrier-protein] synthase I n=1 Tax=Papaver atlanticum TaxID=357466 RepID=A0AAD4XTX8_9MAGN|nr:hypothetical protein MKW98_027745 [Papaver atlanticum]
MKRSVVMMVQRSSPEKFKKMNVGIVLYNIGQESLRRDPNYTANSPSQAYITAHKLNEKSNWRTIEKKERTGVFIGAGTGCISDILDAAKMICEKRLRQLSPFFIPRISINIAAGHVSMRYGFKENGGCGFFEWCDNSSATHTSSYSSRVHESASNTSAADLPCLCGIGSCLVMAAKTGQNVGRQFYRCPNQGSSRLKYLVQYSDLFQLLILGLADNASVVLLSQ